MGFLAPFVVIACIACCLGCELPCFWLVIVACVDLLFVLVGL